MKVYELQVEGYHSPLTAEQIAEHFSAGFLRKNDLCRELDRERWRTIDELFPLLKYDSSSASTARPIRMRASVLDRNDSSNNEDRPITSALKAGWVCFGLGLAMSWFFPFGNVFFSIAIITAVVAMCSHQVNRGLVLLLSTFCAIILCAFVLLTLVLGTIGIIAAPAIAKADVDLKRMHEAQLRTTRQLNASLEKIQPSTINLPATQPPNRFPMPASLVSNAARQESQAIADANTAARQTETDKARTREVVRQAEQQRDRINVKQQRLELLQKGIESYDHMIQEIRDRGGDTKYWDEKRDRMLREQWELQR